MTLLSRHAPWFHMGGPGTEPWSYRAWKWALQRLTARCHQPDLFGRIAETEWDLLVILDACRYDVLADVADSVVVEPAISPVTVTQRFVEKVNRTGLFDRTTYVSANPATRHLDTANVEHVPAYDTAWNTELSTVVAGDVYEQAVDRVRDGETVVAHTLQPHYPHVCRVDSQVVPVPGGLHPASIGSTQDETPIQNIPYAFFRGLCDAETARQSYTACTRYAWEEAERTAFELAADGYTVAITADHGELLGEWGMAGHPWRVRVRPLVEVPWVVIEQPERQSNATDSVHSKLEALGYV